MSTQIEATIDREAAKAAQLAGAPLACIGLLVWDRFGQLAWYNRAHREFASALWRTDRTETIAIVGVTAKEDLYVNVNAPHKHWDEARVAKVFNWRLLLDDIPKKSELSIARLLRSNLAERVRAGVVNDKKLVSIFSQVPEYATTFYLRTADEGYSATWDEPSGPLSIVNLEWTPILRQPVKP